MGIGREKGFDAFPSLLIQCDSAPEVPRPMLIRRLDPLVIDRIAAGEVIERPAAAIKELVENALDAGAKHDRGRDRSRRATADPGRRRRARDGRCRSRALRRAARDVEVSDGDLTAIATFGFRGEALPSVASVSQLEIRTRAAGAPSGFLLIVEAESKARSSPAPRRSARGSRRAISSPPPQPG